MRLIIFVILFFCVALPAHAGISNTTGPWGISVKGLGFTNLSSAAQYCATATDTLVVDKVITANSMTLPKNCQLSVTKRGRIDVAAGQTFNYGGQIPTAGRYQIHGGAGSVVNMGEAYPEWFGSNTTPGTTDMADAIIKASAASKTLNFARSVYAISKSLPFPTQAAWHGRGAVIKALPEWAPTIPLITALTYSPVLEYAPMLYAPSAIDWWSISGILFDGNGQDCYGIWLAENYHGDMRDVVVTNTNKRPYTNIRGQQVVHTDFAAYSCADGVLTYDTTGLKFITSGFERLGGSWSFDQRQPNSYSKGGVTLDDCWFESETAHHPTDGFLRLSGRRNSVKMHAAYHTTATTELLFKLNDTTDSIIADGITMGAQACTNADIWVNDASSSMGVVAAAGSNGNRVRGAFVASKIVDSGTGNSWDMNASLNPQLPHVTGRFQVRFGDNGSGIPLTSTSYVFDADYNAGTPIIRLLSALATISNNSGTYTVTSSGGQSYTAGGGIAFSGSDYTLTGAGGATGYQKPLYLGVYAIWVDSAGKLRIKSGAPASDTDGTIIGTQS